MKKGFVFFIGIVFTGTLFAQTKYSLLKEISEFKQEQIIGYEYNKTKKMLYDSLYVFFSKDYVVTQSSKTGIVKAKANETIHMNEERSFETKYFVEVSLSDTYPVRVEFKKWKERRSFNRSTKEYGEWKSINQTNEGIDIKFYEMINGFIPLPVSLQQKVNDYNIKQPSEKLQLFEGRDY